MTLTRRLLLTLTATLLLPAAAARADVGQKLSAGEILAISVPSRTGVRAGRAMGVVDAPPDRVLQLLSSFADYQQFIPRVTSSRRLSADRYRIQAKLPWPVEHTWVDIKVHSGNQKGVRVLQWKMEQGSFAQYEGTAWILPWKKTGSLVTYQMRAVPKITAPEGMFDKGMRAAAKQVIKAVRKRLQGEALTARAAAPFQVASR